MENLLEIIIEEHQGLSPSFGEWHLVAKLEDHTIGSYYIHYGVNEKGQVYIHDSKLRSDVPRQHIPRFLIQQCSSFLAKKAEELNQPITHTVRFHHEEVRCKLQPLFKENEYADQGVSHDLRRDWVMTRTYEPK